MGNRTRSAAAADPLQERIAALGRESPETQENAAVLGALLPLLNDADPGASPIAMTADQVRSRLAQGQPLLRGMSFEIDEIATRDLLVGLARALEEALRSESARQIRNAVERDDPGVAALLPPAAAGDRETVAAIARRRDLDAALLWRLAQAALQPALRAWRRALAPLAEGFPWQRDACLVCGAPAILGEVRENGAHHLRCLQCGADWRIRRLVCPSCGNEDHASLQTLYEESRRETRRVEACGRCRRYIKLVAATAALPDELLAVEDLATVGLDRAAQEHGFLR